MTQLADAPAHPLATSAGQAALTAAQAEGDPGSLAAATRLRRTFEPDVAAAALAQVGLRRRAAAKLGAWAADGLFTPTGLEQASRGSVSRWRAARFAALGATEVWDLGCGNGADARALVEAGIDVVAVERDATTAACAAWNLALPGAAGAARVAWGDAEAVDVPAGAAVFVDPARRDARGRVWGTDGLTPSWDAVTRLLASGRAAAAKVGPGIAHNAIPGGVLAEWVSDGGDVVECGLWAGPGVEPGMAATSLPSGDRIVRDDTPAPAVTGPRAWLAEPDGAALRAGCLPRLASAAGATLVARDVAYLAADAPTGNAWLTWFEVVEELPHKEAALRAWVKANGVGTLEIKKRGVELDPAQLRKKLRPAGANAATIVVTPTPAGVRALVCRRAAAAA